MISLARPEGFEPPTPRFVVCCSLSNQKLVVNGRRSKCSVPDGERALNLPGSSWPCRHAAPGVVL
jgi:hypothetical protein